MCVAVMQAREEMASTPAAPLLPGCAAPGRALEGGPGVCVLRGVRDAPTMSTLYI